MAPTKYVSFISLLPSNESCYLNLYSHHVHVSQQSNSIAVKREVVIRALCEYLNEDIGILVKHFSDTQKEEMKEQQERSTMGIFVSRKAGEWDLPADVSLVVEGVEILSNISDVATACALLFGVIYAMNLSYPKEHKYLFEVLQKIIMELDTIKYSPKVQGLRNKLFL
ncbi:uncharacterized protein LOC119733814 [Patiria miniata]|uniref:Uncharacterized protein n=1 Tax=Patiria miniata TaxID=46514 RepID=A0A914AHU7_PATMI|nr:uncharacterized protein LOC119733814 [Patiria miniata]